MRKIMDALLLLAVGFIITMALILTTVAVAWMGQQAAQLFRAYFNF